MNKKILVFGIVVILNFSAFFVLANDIRESIIDSGSISGYVRQVNSIPINDATVEVTRPDGTGLWETKTDSDGNYIFDGLPSGDYKVRAYKSSYAREYFDNVYSSTEAKILTIIDTKEISNVDFILTLGGSISGHIYQIDGVTPIDGAEVFVRPSMYRFDDGFWSTTDSQGGFTVDSLYLGNYKITAKADGYVELIKFYNDSYGWENAWDILVTPPEDTSEININLERAGSISGFVFKNDGLTPIPYVSVTADEVTGKFVEGFGASTNDDGSYSIKNILHGIYTVRTDPPLESWFAGEFYDSEYMRSNADIVVVYEDSDTSNINFTLDEGGSITGHVYDENTNEPLQNIELWYYMLDGYTQPPVASTSYDGSYKFVLPPGEYFIGIGTNDYCVLGYRYVPEWYDNVYDFSKATRINVDLFKETSEIDFYLARSGSISGNVYNEDGEPINDASVYAFSDIYSGNGAISSENGSYKIEGLHSGDYRVQVTVSGFNSEYYDNVSDPADATLVSVNAPDETKNIDFILTKGIGVYISRPEIGVLYLFDKEILSLPFNYPIIVGKINVKAVAFGADKVEFYIDDELKYTDDESPFSWLWDEVTFGRHTLKVVVYEVVDVVSNEMTVWKFF